MITIADIIQHLEAIAPPAYQESYDNAGLLVGDASATCTGVLTCLDSTEAVIAEAVAKGCNLVVAHHPIIFKGVRRLTGKTYIERTVMAAIRHDVAIYAIHTNLDNVYSQGVNARIAQQLGLVNTRILAPVANLRQADITVPVHRTEQVKAAVQAAADSPQTPQPVLRQSSLGVLPDGMPALHLEICFPTERQNAVERTLRSFEGVDYRISAIDNANPLTGSGMLGDLPRPMKALNFLKTMKEKLQVACVKHTALPGDDMVKTVALCGGAGGFLLPRAIAAKAQVFITADYKYHEFFDADGRIIIADIGHFESEQFTIPLLAEIIQKNFTNFAVVCAEVSTNPVQYL